jgi:hypothetical protein
MFKPSRNGRPKPKPTFHFTYDFPSEVHLVEPAGIPLCYPAITYDTGPLTEETRQLREQLAALMRQFGPDAPEVEAFLQQHQDNKQFSGYAVFDRADERARRKL